jgi:hypothetical protein
LKTKLLLLDVALALMVAVLALQVRDKWFEARKREQVMLGQQVAPLAPPPFTPFPLVGSLRAAEFAAVAEKTLFSPDRNPTVILDVVAPKPMPALPLYFGIMDLGEGPRALMAAKGGDQPSEVAFGGKIGEFKLVSVRDDKVLLEWEGKKIEKRASDLTPQNVVVERASSGSASPAAQSSNPSPALSIPSEPVEAAPGKATGGGFRACVAGDNSPGGTVRDGMRKVVVPSPFGKICRWEPAQ